MIQTSTGTDASIATGGPVWNVLRAIATAVFVAGFAAAAAADQPLKILFITTEAADAKARGFVDKKTGRTGIDAVREKSVRELRTALYLAGANSAEIYSTWIKLSKDEFDETPIENCSIAKVAMAHTRIKGYRKSLPPEVARKRSPEVRDRFDIVVVLVDGKDPESGGCAPDVAPLDISSQIEAQRYRAYAAVDINNVFVRPDLYSVVHEIGHRLGASHDIDHAFKYSETFDKEAAKKSRKPGFGALDAKYRIGTVMAYVPFAKPWRRILEFSNGGRCKTPRFEHVTCGNSEANNASIVRRNLRIVRTFGEGL